MGKGGGGRPLAKPSASLHSQPEARPVQGPSGQADRPTGWKVSNAGLFLRSVAGCSRLQRCECQWGAGRSDKKLGASCPEQMLVRPSRSSGLDESATSLFVLPINEQQNVAMASLLDAPDPMPRPSARSRLVA